MPQTDESFSRRAEILTRVLDWVNQDRFEDHDSWMLFGNRGADIGGQMEVLFERTKPEDESDYQILGQIQGDVGKVIDARRTSLEPRPPRISGEDIVPAHWRTRPEDPSLDVTEYLDACYSAELLGKLEKIVERAASLEPHAADVDQIHDAGLRAYFREAHRCYLYGFNAACAVMCRAILESAVKAKFHPHGRIESYLPPGHSLVKTLIRESNLEEPLKDGAERIVKKAGDDAIHNYRKFEREYVGRGKMEEILDITRKVLAEIYPQSPYA